MLNASLVNGHIGLPLTVNNMEKYFEEKKGIEDVALPKMLSTPHCHL